MCTWKIWLTVASVHHEPTVKETSSSTPSKVQTPNPTRLRRNINTYTKVWTDASKNTQSRSMQARHCAPTWLQWNSRPWSSRFTEERIRNWKSLSVKQLLQVRAYHVVKAIAPSSKSESSLVHYEVRNAAHIRRNRALWRAIKAAQTRIQKKRFTVDVVDLVSYVQDCAPALCVTGGLLCCDTQWYGVTVFRHCRYGSDCTCGCNSSISILLQLRH